MRLWSIHPSYLDSKGLVALWREGLLAQKVLQGKTKGYKNHPQLVRFKNASNPNGAISKYLQYVAGEADNRGYNFDKNKIISAVFIGLIPVTDGQIKYEFQHLINKVKERDAKIYMMLTKIEKIEVHPMFAEIPGNIEKWEIILSCKT